MRNGKNILENTLLGFSKFGKQAQWTTFRMKRLGFVMLSTLVLFTSCDLEKDIDLELPEYEVEPVIQCFLTEDQPVYMLLSYSSSYFDSISFDSNDLEALGLIEGATGSINVYSNDSFPLTPFPGGVFFSPDNFIFNYFAAPNFPRPYDTDYTLDLNVPGVGQFSATAKIPSPVEIDTMEAVFNENNEAIVLTRFLDDASTRNYYRFKLEKFRDGDRDRIYTLELDDDVFNGEQVTFNTLYEFEAGDTAIATLYHIEKSWYDFIESSEDAASANGNPFGQPSAIKSNIPGAVGIFTGYSIRRDTLIVTQ